MPPQTPRSNAKSGVSITPSFTFGLGLLPSFRFASPRNLNLLNSLSPQRFFNKFTKREEEKKDENPFEHSEIAVSDDPEKATFDLDKHSDSLCTDSADIWLLTNDSQYQSLSLNLTSVNEDTPPKSCEPFLSPHDIFLKKPAEIKEASETSPAEKGDTPASACSSIKRKRSIEDSPCGAVIAEISKHDSPVTTVPPYGELEKASKELWFAELDDVLVRCRKKYRAFKDSQSPGSTTLTKLTSQNQVLSRMLYEKTGVRRSSKQIASRLSRLRKAELTRNKSKSHEVTFPPLSLVPSSPGTPPLDFAFRKMQLSFTYRQAVQGIHNFFLLEESPHDCPTLSPEDVTKEMSLRNRRCREDFERILLRLEEVPIYSVTGVMNLKPTKCQTSTPVSPLTDPALFSDDNGDFLSFVEFKVAAKQRNVQFLSWRSLTTIYKDEDKVLLSTREQINGYRDDDNTFNLQVPFMNHFWAGYLTFLSNGSNNTADIKNLVITQTIFEGDDETTGVIHGFLKYTFEIASHSGGKGIIKVSKIRKTEKPFEDDLDENATVLAHSSPFKSSPNKGDLSVNTHLANQGLNVLPTYNASLVQQNLSQELQGRQPLTAISQNTNHFQHAVQSSTPYSAVDPPTTHPFNASAGQMPQNFYPGVTPSWSPNSQYNPSLQSQMAAQAAAIQAAAQSMPLRQGSANNEQFAQDRFVSNAQTSHNLNGAAMTMQRRPDLGFDGDFAANGMTQSIPSWQSHGYPNAPPQYMNHMTQPSINSAPASQLHFFPPNEVRQNTSVSRKSSHKTGEIGDNKPNNNNITFGPIMGYDPSRDNKQQPKKPKNGMNIHKFSLNPQIMYKPKKQ